MNGPSRLRNPVGMVLALTFVLGGCMGKNYRPVVDPKGADMSHYEADLVECQNIAGEQSVIADATQTAAVGATAGAVVGAIVGAILGNAGAGAATGAGYGGGTGAVDGSISGLRGQSAIVANCMSGRGYKVLQ